MKQILHWSLIHLIAGNSSFNHLLVMQVRSYYVRGVAEETTNQFERALADLEKFMEVPNDKSFKTFVSSASEHLLTCQQSGLAITY